MSTQPNNALQPTASRCALRFRRSLRSLGAAERGRHADERDPEHL